MRTNPRGGNRRGKGAAPRRAIVGLISGIVHKRGAAAETAIKVEIARHPRDGKRPPIRKLPKIWHVKVDSPEPNVDP